MVKGIGLDITLVSRMRRSIGSGRFLERVFCDEERSYLDTRADLAESAAGIFSAKEAILKAMGKGIGDVPLQEIRIAHDASGRPRGRWQEIEFDVSISHMGDVAAAVALWQDR